MPRQLFLAVYPAHPFADHWALFVPSNQNSHLGTIIQVEGQPRSGFKHDIQRHYNVDEERRTIKLKFIGNVSDKSVHDTLPLGDLIEETMDRKDDIEMVAMSIPAPGPSMRPVEESKACGAAPRGRVNFSDCQWWARKVVETLIAKAILECDAMRLLEDTVKK